MLQKVFSSWLLVEGKTYESNTGNNNSK